MYNNIILLQIIFEYIIIFIIIACDVKCAHSNCLMLIVAIGIIVHVWCQIEGHTHIKIITHIILSYFKCRLIVNEFSTL